jgi:hypothetical protein
LSSANFHYVKATQPDDLVEALAAASAATTLLRVLLNEFSMAQFSQPKKPGGVVEWLMAPVLKTGRAQALVGSNPTPSASLRFGEKRKSEECHAGVKRRRARSDLKEKHARLRDTADRGESLPVVFLIRRLSQMFEV